MCQRSVKRRNTIGQSRLKISYNRINHSRRSFYNTNRRAIKCIPISDKKRKIEEEEEAAANKQQQERERVSCTSTNKQTTKIFLSLDQRISR